MLGLTQAAASSIASGACVVIVALLASNDPMKAYVEIKRVDKSKQIGSRYRARAPPEAGLTARERTPLPSMTN